MAEVCRRAEVDAWSLEVVGAGVDRHWMEGRWTLAVVASAEVGEWDQMGMRVAHEMAGLMGQIVGRLLLLILQLPQAYAREQILYQRGEKLNI